MKKLTILLGFLFIGTSVFGQTAPFNVSLEPVNIPQLGGIQSYAIAQHEGKWLILGGRLDGLHRRQPFAAFDQAGHNNQLIVVDPVSLEKWSASLSSLPASMQEQLSSTNMEFFQEGEYLYCFGGYGYSASLGDHTTYPNMTAIKVPGVIDAVIANTDFSSYFRQISDPEFQVTGGYLQKINEVYHLLGGQKFLGRYNPMGPTHGPGFTQEYTNSIRRFTLTDDGTTIVINHLPAYIDSENLHRRDYNAVAQILPNGQEGITMFSGVFHPVTDLPYLTSVTVDSASYALNDSFQQYYNHYHCAVMPLYSASNNEMHTVFFGGIAQYYDSAGVMIQDNNVPFVNTIARVTRDANGNMTEHKLPVEMPALLGSGAEFIPDDDLPQFANGVLALDEISEDSILVGYIYGGISSSAANIFWSNTGAQSTASSQIFKVYLIQDNPLSIHQFNERSTGALELEVYPNPNEGKFMVQFQLRKAAPVTITLYALNGQKVKEVVITSPSIGHNDFLLETEELASDTVLLLTVETDFEQGSQKVVIR